MLADLRKVEDKFYNNESIQIFLKSRSIEDAIRLLNKASKQETRTRITKFFYKLSESLYYKQLLIAGLNDDPQKKEEFKKYIFSDYCEEYYQLLMKKTQDVLSLVQNDHKLMSVLFSLVYPSQGIKMINFFKELYEKYSDHDCLYEEGVQEQINLGIGAEDSVVQMRFVQIIANIAVRGGKAFKFVEKTLEESLNIYQTDDILLKLNIVQIVSMLGEGLETSKLLRGHKIWSKVQKDAMDPDQQFYVRKSMLLLLVQMAAHEQYQMSPKFVKNLIQFLKYCFSNKGEYLEAALDISGRLCLSGQGAKILVQNSEVFNKFLIISRTNNDQTRIQFLEVLAMLTDKTTGKKNKPIIINILSCIGNPNLSAQLSHNLNSNNFIVAGIEPFCKWFSQFMVLPFEDLEMKIIGLFLHLIEYVEICELLFQEQNVTKFLLKPMSVVNSNKVLRMEKGRLIHSIIDKGEKEWKETKLGYFSAMLQKQLKKEKAEIAYALDVE